MSETQQPFYKVDKLDNHILYLLDANARTPASTIAKELSVPEATVRYRIQSLLSSGVISNSYPVLGVGRVGMSVHKFMFKLQKANEQEINRFVNYLVAHRLVNWVARFDGNYDAGCTMLVRNVGEVSEFLDQTRKRFHLNIREMSYAVNVRAEFFARDYLVRKRRSSTAAYSAYSSYSEKLVALDQLDWDILRAVTNDTRSSATQIADKLGCSSETIGRRLRELEKQEVVTGYRLVLDPTAIGRTSYYMLVYLNFVSEDRLARMLSYLRAHPAVVYLIKMLGEWDYDISLELKDSSEHRAFMIDLMQHFSDVIRDLQTLTTWQVAKFSILPKTSAALNGQ